MKMVFVARIIRHKLCMKYAFFDFFVQKLSLAKNYFLIAKMNLTSRGPLYTCLVLHDCRGQWEASFELDGYFRKFIEGG